MLCELSQGSLIEPLISGSVPATCLEALHLRQTLPIDVRANRVHLPVPRFDVLRRWA